MVAESVVLLTQASRFKGVMVRGPLGRGASARYQVLSAVLLKIQVFCIVTWCWLVNTDIFGWAKYLSIRGKVIQQDSTSPKRRQLPADTA
jgi:hypothetical protein